jgi:hypothetical protein
MELWESDLVYVKALGKFNDKYKYFLTVIDVLSKFLHIAPQNPSRVPLSLSAFWSIFNDPKYSKSLQRRHIWVRTVKGKEFFNKSLHGMSRHDDIRFQVRRHPNVKRSTVEQSHRTIVINCTNTSPIKTRTDTLTNSPNLLRPTTTRFTYHWYGAMTSNGFRYTSDME